MRRKITAIIFSSLLAMPTIAQADLAVGNGSSPTLTQSFVAPSPLPVNITGQGIGSDTAMSSFTSTLGDKYTTTPQPGVTYLLVHIPVGASVSFYTSIGQAGNQSGAQSLTQTYSNTASGATSNLDVRIYTISLNTIWFTSITCGASTTQTLGCPSYRWM